MRTFTRLAAAPSALILTAGLLAGCNDPNEDSGSTETVSPEDSMEDDSMEEDDAMEEEDAMEEDDAMEDEG